jgi:hypothetical protein
MVAWEATALPLGNTRKRDSFVECTTQEPFEVIAFIITDFFPLLCVCPNPITRSQY